MSELSDEIKNEMRVLHDSPPAKADSDGIVDTEEIDVEGFKESREYFDQEIIRVLRRTYRRFSGISPFESGLDAINRTEDVCISSLTPVVSNSFSSGVMIGRGDSPVVRKYKLFGDSHLAGLFNQESFIQEMNLLTFSKIYWDSDAADAMRSYLITAFGHVAVGAGYVGIQGSPAAGRIWNCWHLGAQSACFGMYLCGYKLGKRWAEQDIIEGIMAASEDDNKN